MRRFTYLLILVLFTTISYSQTSDYIDQLNKGESFEVILLKDNGTLKANSSYNLVFENGKYVVTGYNSDQYTNGTWAYSNADPNMSEISLWGAVYVFDGKGNLFDKSGLAGSITLKTNWATYIESGKKFKAKLDNDHGTIKKGEVYDIIYSSDQFIVTGYNNGLKRKGTWQYKNAKPEDNEISIWGVVFTFDEDDFLYDKEGNKAGVIIK